MTDNKSKMRTIWKDRKKSIAFILCIALIAITIGGNLTSFAGDPQDTNSIETMSSPGAITEQGIDKEDNTEDEQNDEEQSSDDQEDQGIVTKDDQKEPEPKQKKTKSSGIKPQAGDDEDNADFLSRFTVSADGKTITSFFPDGYNKTELVIPEEIKAGVKVTTLGTNSFQTIKEINVSKVSIPDSVTNIGANTFTNCSKLTEVDFPSSLTSISNYAFQGTGLTDVNLPSGVTSIGHSGFYQCVNLTSVSLPEGLKTINANAFRSCSSLKNIVLPNSLTTIGNEAFRTSPLESIIIPANVKTIPTNCFYDCKLESVQLQEGLQSIGSSAFHQGIKSGVTVVIPASVKTIGTSAFGSMANGVLDLSAHDPGSISGATWNSLDTTLIKWKDNNDSHFWVDVDGYIVGIKPAGHGASSCTDSAYHSNSLDLVFPKSVVVNGVNTPIKGIAAYAFQNNTKIKSIAFETGSQIEEIKAGTFNKCTSLHTIVMSDSIKTIGTEAFRDCNALKNITWSNNLKTIGSSAFHFSSNSRYLTEIVLPNSVEVLGQRCFYRANISKLVLSENLKSIGTEAFYYSRLLKELTIPASVEKIEARAFIYNVLHTVNVKGSDTMTIGTQAFESNDVKTINITGRAVDTVKNSAWGAQYAQINWKEESTPPEVIVSDDGLWHVNRKNNTLVNYAGTFKDIDTLVVPARITGNGIGTDLKIVNTTVFLNKGSLKEVVFEEGVEKLVQAIFRGCKIDKVTLSKSIYHMDNSCFQSNNVKEIVIPEGSELNRIKANVFNGNMLTEVNIPPKATHIDVGAYANNNIQGEVFIPANIVGIDPAAFTNNPGITSIYLDMYRADAPNAVKNNAKFGATNAQIIYKGELPETKTKAIDKDDRARNIVFEAIVPAKSPNISRMYASGSSISLLPDGYSSNYRVDGSKPYSVYENGTYTIFVHTVNGKYPHEVVIDDIGRMDIDADNVKYSVKKSGDITKSDLLNNSNAKAKDLDSGNTQSGISYEISDNDMDKVNGLKKAGENTDITITVKYTGTYPSGAPKAGQKYVNTTKTVIKVKLVEETAKVNFNSNGGTPTATERSIVVDNKNGNALGSANMPADPIRDGYQFKDWVYQSDNTKAFNADTLITEDTNLVAKWDIRNYTMFFNTDDADTETPKAQQITYGALAEKVSDPQKQGNEFKGWTDSKGQIWDFQVNTMPAMDVTLTAQWSANDYQVDFGLNGGEGKIPAKQTVKYGQKVDNPNGKITKKGYIFDGWYTEKISVGGSLDPAKKWNFDSHKVEKDITLYAGWDVYEYMVNFDVNAVDVNKIDGMKVNSPDTTLKNLPQQPTRIGFTFDGWNTSKDGSGKNFNTKYEVTGDMTVYGIWNADFYQLSFSLNGKNGKTPATQSLKYNDHAKAVNNPEADKSTFTQWNTAKDGSGKAWNFKSDKMPAEHVVLYAQWKDDDNDSTGGGNQRGTNNNPGPNNGDGNSSGQSGPASTSDNTPKEAATVTDIMDKGLVPSAGIGDSRIPLHDGGLFGSWALLNLILGIAGGFTALYTIIKALLRRKEEQKDEEYRLETQEQEDEKKNKPIWIIASILFAIGGLLLFFLTQDMSLAMVLVDKWTVFSALFFIASAISTFVAFKRTREDNEFDDPSYE